MNRRAVWLGVGCTVLIACAGPPAPIYDRSANPYRRVAESDSRIDRPSHYVVRRGDTLYAIAWRYGLDFKSLARWNGIGEPYVIHPEQRLRLTEPREMPVVETRALPEQPIATPAPTAAAARPEQTTPEPTVKPEPATVVSRKPPPAPTQRPAVDRPAATGGGEIAWRWPADGPILSTFAAGNSGRKGLDIAGEPGQAVRAAAAGEVVYSGSGLVGYGELIIIKHDQRFLSAYGHNRKRLVEEGDRVEAGQQIAEMGQTGANRPMLHFEIRDDGDPVNPQAHLPRR